MNNAQPVDGGLHRQIERSAYPDGERACGVNLDGFAVPLVFPQRYDPAGEFSSQTGMREQISRVLGASSDLQIGR